ncbi:hypothetical protein TorRG33x02_191570 [Trema orientale]|uniref:Uncharacterized protein n=1 Tax=Trema orientale TaxID=63057 RepID=A0A2P5EHN4_TREOI|nr:hypothetical protein TorRG33x02_191570 [Trema orientale]
MIAKEKRSEQGRAKGGASWVPPSRPPSLTTWAVLSLHMPLPDGPPQPLPGGSQPPPLPRPSLTFYPPSSQSLNSSAFRGPGPPHTEALYLSLFIYFFSF